MRETSGGAVFTRHARSAAVVAVAMMLVAPAAMAARGDRAAATEEPAARSAPVVRNTVDELKQLMDARQLTELRTTYNGNYGASLLFNASTLTYYVALFQEKNFWRVIKTDAVDNAERVYRTFAQQSEQLAQVYIDTTRLEAGKRYTERLVAYNEARLRTLQQEMEQQQAQSAQVSAALQQAQQQAVSLSTDVQSTNSQLDALQRRIQILQAEQGNPELSLPKPDSVPSPAPAAASDGR
jgi:polyhydroxyalkanoate synthesis regulator phasin